MVIGLAEFSDHFCKNSGVILQNPQMFSYGSTKNNTLFSFLNHTILLFFLVLLVQDFSIDYTSKRHILFVYHSDVFLTLR